MWSSKESLGSPSCRQRPRVTRCTHLARRTLRRGRLHGSARNQSRPLAGFRLRSDGLPNSSRTTGKSETIDSSVGLVPINALVFRELSRFIDWPETGFAEVWAGARYWAAPRFRIEIPTILRVAQRQAS